MRSFSALAFVPERRIVEYFNILSDSVPVDSPQEVFDFVEYVADTYIGREIYERADAEEQGDMVIRLRRNPRWKDPKILPQWWSVYERVLNDEPRTTNMLEGWHRRFGELVAKYHPYIYDFIGCLRSEQSRTDTVIGKLLMGNAPQGMRKAEKDKTARLKNIVGKFEEREPIEYLR